MDIQIVKTETYDFTLTESKFKSFNFDDIMYLTGTAYQPEIHNKPQYVVFKTREEFLENVNKYDIDKTKQILINDKGNFFCPIKDGVTISESKETDDETGDSE